MSDIDASQVQWDAQPPPIDPKSVQWDDAPTAMDALKHGVGLAGRMVTSAVGGLPYMAMDAGVGGRNVIGDAYNKLVGNQPTPDYDLPSADFRAWQDKTFGKPQNKAENVEDFLAPVLLSGGATAAPKVASTLLGGAVPELGTAAGGIAGEVSTAPAIAASQQSGQASMLASLLKRSQDAGYVVPPSSVNPSVINTATESLAGKIATQQAASIRNQPVTNRLAAEANGLNPSAPITKGALVAARAEAAKGYEAVRAAGDIPTDNDYLTKIADIQARFLGKNASFPGSKVSPLVSEADNLAVNSFDASHAVDKIGELRDLKSAAYRAGNSQEGRGYGDMSNALEEQMDRVLQAKASSGQVSPGLVSDFRNARQKIAISHSTEEALNDSTGNVSAQTLARMLKNDQPLSGGLRTAGEFGSSFGKAAQAPENVGSPVGHTNTLAALLMGGLAEGATHSHYALGAGLAWPMLRSGAKAYALGRAQKGLPDALAGLNDLGPTQAKADALAQGLSQMETR